MTKKKIKQSQEMINLISRDLIIMGKKRVNARSNIRYGRQWQTISPKAKLRLTTVEHIIYSKAKLKVITAQDVFLTVKDNMSVNRYNEINNLEAIRKFWTKKIEKEESIEQISDEKIFHSMTVIMKGELDRYIHYSKLETINPRRTTPSPDLTKVAQNIFYYLKDILKMIRGISDLPAGLENPRAFMLAETLNIFQNLKPDDKKQFVEVIDGTIKEKSKPIKTD